MPNDSNGNKLRRWCAIWLGITVVLLGWLSGLVHATWTASADRTRMVLSIEANDETLADHEVRMRKVENMAADVRWIRARMESLEEKKGTSDGKR